MNDKEVPHPEGGAQANASLTSSAPYAESRFLEPWMRRVRDVDDHTLAGLLRSLVQLRRLRNAVTLGAGLLGAFVFGLLRTANPLYGVMIHVFLAFLVGLPVFAIGSLSVRRLFLRDAHAQGLSHSAGILVLTRATRRARFLAPWKRTDEHVEALLHAVRDPDRAD